MTLHEAIEHAKGEIKAGLTMKIATALIQGNGRFDIHAFEAEGVQFSVFAKQTPGECRTGRVSIYIKAGSEKAQKIGFYGDVGTVDDVRAYVLEEILSDAS